MSSSPPHLHAFDVHPPIPAAQSAVPLYSPTSLDNSKSPVDRGLETSESQDFAFPHVRHFRSLVHAALVALDYPEKSRDRYRDCCRHAIVLRNSRSNQLKVAYNTCGSRLCPRCAISCRSRSALAIASAIGRVKPRVWRFITLTLGSDESSLSDQLLHLTSSFRRLRQTQLWQSTQLKGYGIIEITHNRSTGLWHPHLHILSRGIYIPQRSLSRQWLLCSRGSPITDIRALSSSTRAAAYVAKYLGKAPDFIDHPRAQALTTEWVAALRNRKLIIPFGARTVVYDDDAPSPALVPDGHWEWLCSLTNLLIHAREGMPEAKSLLDQLLHRGSFGRSPPHRQVANGSLLIEDSSGH